MSISYTKGDATQPQGDGTKIIMHVCNDIGGWGRGFVVALSQRWPEPEACYRSWYKNKTLAGKDLNTGTKKSALHSPGQFALGQVQVIQVLDDTYVANLVAQHGVTTVDGVPPIRYAALRECFTHLKVMLENFFPAATTLHAPRLGCGLAGGSWDHVEPIIQEVLPTFSVTVYDWHP